MTERSQYSVGPTSTLGILAHRFEAFLGVSITQDKFAIILF